MAVVLGVSLSVLFAQSKWVELSFFPYAVILQVTPIVAIAPLIIIWVDDVKLSLLICAWIVAFFPILSNTTLGLNSADHNLLNLFQLYKATRFQTLRYITIPLLGSTIRLTIYLSVLGAIQIFDLVWVMTTGGPVNASNTMATYLFKFGFQRFQLGYGSAIASIMFLICFGFSLVYQRAVMRRDFQ